MNRPLKCVAAFVVALFGSVILFSTTLLNETHPVLPFLVCPPVFALAGVISSLKEDRQSLSKDFWKWVLWAAVVGIVAAICFTVSKH